MTEIYFKKCCSLYITSAKQVHERGISNDKNIYAEQIRTRVK